jgi:hypothetical protein
MKTTTAVTNTLSDINQKSVARNPTLREKESKKEEGFVTGTLHRVTLLSNLTLVFLSLIFAAPAS